MSSTIRADLLHTAQAFIESYNTWTVDALLSVRSPLCIHYTLPADEERFPPRTNTEYGAFVQAILPMFRDFRLRVVDEDEVVVDVEKRKVVFHAKSSADTDVGEYANEYVFTLTMTEDGRLVEKVVEFFDSGYSEKFFGKLLAGNKG
jgi:ketosteroid isomerase-like protein